VFEAKSSRKPGSFWVRGRPQGLWVSRMMVLAGLGGAVFTVFVGVAFGAAPEVPLLSVGSPVPATSATFLGTLSPAATKPGEGGTYKFLYRASKTECKGGFETAPGVWNGVEHEELPPEVVSGLSANTTYSVCLSVTNTAKEATVSARVTFRTALPPEVPETKPQSPFGATTATLNGVLNPKKPGNSGSYEFVYRPSESECRGAGELVTGAVEATGAEKELAKAEVTGLLANASYTFCVLARNEAGESAEGAPVSFMTLSAQPIIENEASPTVTGTEAQVTAKINPTGSETEYEIQYGETGYESTVPAGFAAIGKGRSSVAVTQTLTKLHPDITYHWRVIAKNAGGTSYSPDQTFVYDTHGTGLPDGRHYELVTPPHKNGATIGGLFARHDTPVVSESGTNVIGPSDQCFADPESCVGYRLIEGESYEFSRTPSGWVTTPLAPPASSFEAYSYLTVNANTGTELFSAPGYPGGPDDFFGRDADGAITPAIGPLGEPREGAGVKQVGPAELSGTGAVSNAYLNHVVYETTESLWLSDHGEHDSVYEYVGTANSTPSMVGVKGGLNSDELVSECNTTLGSTEKLSGEAVSEDGRTVYFTATGHTNGGCPVGTTAPSSPSLYARVDGESADAHTVLISGPAVTGCDTTECAKNSTESPRVANFEGASSDGSRVFFTDTQQLTDEASESSKDSLAGCAGVSEPGGCNLYESVCAEPCGTLSEAPDAQARELMDVSAGAKETGGPRVQGVMAVSADGSHVYFVAEGVLTGNEESEEHERALDGDDNLYVYAGGHVRFIAILSGAHGAALQWEPNENLIANVTPDGQFLVFRDSRPLTTDDTRTNEGEAASQVFEYDAATGSLRRISVGEDGYDDNGNDETGNAYFVPAFRGGSADSTEPGSRNPTMSENGELVFFESPIALAPGALGDAEIAGGELAKNVYEYYKGQVYLISDGADTTAESFNPEGHGATELLGVGESGANVVFSTFDELVGEDVDTARDYYDAHVCSEAEPCVERSGGALVGCGEGTCRMGGTPAPGVESPSSVTSVGPGRRSAPKAPTNAELLAKALKACHAKKAKKKRVACEVAARKRYVPAKRAGRRRASGSRGRR
jgi:hypothetical protein